jgi:ribonucleoside-diphosphate reductase alpha chain
MHYYFSKVKSIDDNKNYVYDLSLPNTHSFVSNGFVSHNTFIEVLGLYHTAIFFPDIELSMTAQTRENASKLIEEKHREIIKFYPLIANEITSSSFTKDTVEVIFTSGGRIDVMANQQSSKGARRKRLNIEESNLLNDILFQDVLEPIVNIPRRTIGKEALINPEELNGSINFFTTSGFRGSTEFERNIRMVDEMAELKGKIVLGSSWELACHYGRGETKSQILDKKAVLSPTFFAMNYESKWVGSTENSLVDINKVLGLRGLTNAELKGDGKSIYIIGVDVARSASKSNNQTSITICKLKKNKDGKLVGIQLVNLINLPNGLNFNAQAIEIKRIKNLYNAKVIVVDGNGLGIGLLDSLLKETFDPATGESLGCYDTINTDQEPEIKSSEKIVYDMRSQGINSEIIVNFIGVIESGKLQLLEKRQDTNYGVNNMDFYKNNILPYVQTDYLIEEIANLKLKQLSSGKYTVEQATKRVDKDRYSSLAYALWYIENYENTKEVKKINYTNYLFISQNS